MPHDCRNKKLEAGDYVFIPFRVESVSQGERDCNVTLQSINCSATNQDYLPILTCNSKLTFKSNEVKDLLNKEE